MRQSEFLRKGLAMLLALVMTIGFLPGVGSMEVSAGEAGTRGATSIKLIMPDGEGTAENPYQIGTAEELYWFARLVNGTLPIFTLLCFVLFVSESTTLCLSPPPKPF